MVEKHQKFNLLFQQEKSESELQNIQIFSQSSRGRLCIFLRSTVVSSSKYCKKLLVEMDHLSFSLHTIKKNRKIIIIIARHRRRLRTVFPFSTFDGKRKQFIGKQRTEKSKCYIIKYLKLVANRKEARHSQDLQNILK